MNRLIILPGNSARNEAWGEACAAHFKPHFDAVSVQKYTHWETGEKVIDFEIEQAKLAATVAGDTDAIWYVMAKSAGTILALEAVAAGIIAPAKCVFFGMPLDLAAEDLYEEDWSSLENFTVPSVAFHNEYDPVAVYAFTKTKIEAKDTIELVTLSGDTHDYEDFIDYEPRILESLAL